MSASSTAFTISIALSEVKLAGFSTTQLPAAIAGAIFQPAMRNGKFHGTMPLHTPNGSRRTMLLAGGNGLSPRSTTSGSFSAQSAKVWNVDTAPGTSANIAFLIVPPPSRGLDLGDLRAAPVDDLGDRAQLLGPLLARHPRPGPVVERRAGGLRSARCASSRPALATSAIFSPVDGA